MRKTILLGVNGSQIYTGEFEVTTRNGYKEFTASFNIGWAFDTEEVLETRAEDYFEDLWECADDSFKLNMLEDEDITREKAKNNFINDTYYYSGYRAFIDCSCTDFEVDMPNGDTINFETGSCGQCDIRREPNFENTIFTNKEAVFKLLEFWDDFHLREIPEAQEKELNNLLNELAPFEKWGTKFEDFIKDNVRL